MVAHIEIVQAESKIHVVYTDSSREFITKEEAKKRGFVPPSPPPSPTLSNVTSSFDGIYVLNGKIVPLAEINTLNPKNLKSLNMLKGSAATLAYGDIGKNGVIELTTKNGNIKSNIKIDSVTMDSATSGENFINAAIKVRRKSDTIPGKVFTQVETPAQFPGGNEAWTRYIMKVLQNNTNDLLKQNISGTCIVKFIVDKDGSVSDVIATSMRGTKLAEVAINAIRKGPKWIPAMQNGHVVAAYKEQPVTFKLDDELNVRNEPQ